MQQGKKCRQKMEKWAQIEERPRRKRLEAEQQSTEAAELMLDKQRKPWGVEDHWQLEKDQRGQQLAAAAWDSGN